MSPRSRAVAAWIVVALGQAAFVAAHLFLAVGALADESEAHGASHDHDHLAELAAMNDPAMGWMVLGWQALVLAPAAMALVWEGPRARLAVLVVGTLGTVFGVLDGAAHAIQEGNVTALATAVVLVGLPGFIAFVATLAWRREAAPTAAS